MDELKEVKKYRNFNDLLPTKYKVDISKLVRECDKKSFVSKIEEMEEDQFNSLFNLKTSFSSINKRIPKDLNKYDIEIKYLFGLMKGMRFSNLELDKEEVKIVLEEDEEVVDEENEEANQISDIEIQNLLTRLESFEKPTQSKLSKFKKFVSFVYFLMARVLFFYVRKYTAKLYGIVKNFVVWTRLKPYQRVKPDELKKAIDIASKFIEMIRPAKTIEISDLWKDDNSFERNKRNFVGNFRYNVERDALEMLEGYNPPTSIKTIKALASQINNQVKKGIINPDWEDFDELIKQGLNKEAVYYWKEHYKNK